MKIIDQIIDRFSYKQKVGLLILGGVIVGLGGLFMYLLRAHTYIADNPSACVNCHIMTPYYASWSHSSHGRDATCNDCHVPHSSLVAKYGFKAMDGMKHVAYFVTHSERQAIMAEDMSAQVIMNNCIRCHTQLNQELVQNGPYRLYDGQKWRWQSLLGLSPQRAPWRYELAVEHTSS